MSGAYVSVIDLTINRETNRLLRDVFDITSPTKVAWRLSMEDFC